MQSLKQKLIAKIHILKQKVKLEEATYRLILLRSTGQESCKAMNITELEAVLKEFERLGINNRPYYREITINGEFTFVYTNCSKMAKIFSLWQTLGEIKALKDSSNQGLNAFLKHKFNTTYHEINHSNPEFNHIKDKIIEGLTQWYTREIKKVVN